MSGNYPVNCPRCGAPLGSLEFCFEVLAGINAKEYSDPEFGVVNHLSTDAHALQHPEDHGIKNNAFHLARLCWILEYEGSAAIGSGPKWLEESFDGTPENIELEPPKIGERGEFTVAGILPAIPADEHEILIRRWAQSVWEAWEKYHDWARSWVEKYKRE